MRSILLILGIALLAGCSKKDDYAPAPLTDLAPIAVGKYITYRLDSTVWTNFGRNKELHSYEEKNVIDAVFTDAMGRQSYRVFRFIRPIGGTNWTNSSTYTLTPTGNTIEMSEDNRRSIPLAMSVTEGKTWKGNQYISSDPFAGKYTFSNDDNMNDWDFTYQSLGGSETIGGKTINDIVMVTHVDESVNETVNDPAAYAALNRAWDKYAKGIGLVAQELTMWEYQPNPNGSSGYFTGFGVKRSMIDHN